LTLCWLWLHKLGCFESWRVWAGSGLGVMQEPGLQLGTKPGGRARVCEGLGENQHFVCRAEVLAEIAVPGTG